MKILGISGSPHKNGTVSTLVKTVLDGAKEVGLDVSYYNLYDLNISPCKGCLACRKKEGKGCVIQDDMEMLFDEINAADVLVLGSPTYWANVSSQMKLFFDRAFFVFMEETERFPRPLQKGKKAILITACGISYPLSWIAGQSKGTLKNMKQVTKLAGYKVISKIVKPTTYKKPELTEKNLKKARNIGLKLENIIL